MKANQAALGSRASAVFPAAHEAVPRLEADSGTRSRWRSFTIFLVFFLLPIQQVFFQESGSPLLIGASDPILLLIGFWLVFRLLMGTVRIPVGYFCLLNLLAIGVSGFYNQDLALRGVGFMSIFIDLVKIVFLWVYFYAVVNIIEERRDFLLALRCWLFGSVMTAFVGAYGSLAFQITGELNNFATHYRAHGTLNDSNGYAMYLALSFYLALVYRRLAGSPRWVLLVMAIQLMGFMFAASRGGTLAFSCSLALWWLLGASLEKKVAMAACVGGLAALVMLIPDRDALLASNPLTARLTTTTVDLGDGEAAQRVGQWKQAWNEFLYSPIFGTGRANYGQLSRYNVGDYAHNTYLGVLAAAGMFGAATYGSFVLFFAWSLLREHPFLSAGARWPVSALLFAALAEIGLAGMTISIENNRIVWVYLAVLACYRRLYLAGPAPVLAPRLRVPYAPQMTSTQAAVR